MSKIDKLRQAEAQRKNKYYQAVKKPQETATFDSKQILQEMTQIRANSGESRVNTSWLIGIVFLVLLMANFGLTFKLFIMMRGRDNALKQLNKVEKIVLDNSQKINSISLDIKNINLKTQNNNLKLTQLEKQLSSQSQAVDNLTKAKNTLFNRVNLLESNFDKRPE